MWRPYCLFCVLFCWWRAGRLGAANRAVGMQVCNCTKEASRSHKDTYHCGDGCLNRTSKILCDVRACPCRGDCRNKPFNLRRPPAVEVKLTDSRCAC